MLSKFSLVFVNNNCKFKLKGRKSREYHKCFQLSKLAVKIAPKFYFTD